MNRPAAELLARHPRVWVRGVARIAAPLALALAVVSAGVHAEDKVPSPSFVRLRITHRVHAQFQDTVTVAMHERQTVGDSEFDFEAIEFYPHFAILDSTHAVVSLSDEPKNPAFRIRIFQGEEKVEDTWAFYGVKIPHFGRTSYLAFEVLGFEYRGKVIGVAGSAPPAAAPPAKKGKP